jgi:ferredoxin
MSGAIRLRVRVDEARCQGHTLCHHALPEVFSLRDDDEHAYAAIEVVPTALEDAVRAAACECPEGAIQLDQEEV